MTPEPISATATKVSLGAVGSSIGSAFTTTAAYIFTHHAIAGFLVGAGTYHVASKILKKRREKKQEDQQLAQDQDLTASIAS